MTRRIALSTVVVVPWLAVAGLPVATSAAPLRTNDVRYLIHGQRRGITATTEQLTGAGARVLAAYDASYAVRVPEPARDAFLARMALLGLEARELQDPIQTPARRIDPRVDLPPAAPAEPGLFLLQYAAPPLPEWQAAVRATGMIEILPLPERAIVVVATREQLAHIAREPNSTKASGVPITLPAPHSRSPFPQGTSSRAPTTSQQPYLHPRQRKT